MTAGVAGSADGMVVVVLVLVPPEVTQVVASSCGLCSAVSYSMQ